jgi:hypothetical protein
MLNGIDFKLGKLLIIFVFFHSIISNQGNPIPAGFFNKKNKIKCAKKKANPDGNHLLAELTGIDLLEINRLAVPFSEPLFIVR